MRDEISQAICEMITHGIEPAAIIMTPVQLKRLLALFKTDENWLERFDTKDNPAPAGSGWAFEGLPIWRSLHLSGPSVVDRYTLSLLRQGVIRKYQQTGPDEPRALTQHDLLF